MVGQWVSDQWVNDKERHFFVTLKGGWLDDE